MDDTTIIVGFLVGIIGLVMLFAQLKLFSIDRTLELRLLSIDRHLKAIRELLEKKGR